MHCCEKHRASLTLRLIFAVVSLLGISIQAHSQDTVKFRIRYVINTPVVDTTFVDNSDRISDMRSFLETMREDTTLHIIGVRFRGTASPDGGYEFNRWLSENRLRTFKELVDSYRPIPDSIIRANTSDIPWDEFREKVAQSDMAHRDEVLAIIDEEPKLVPWFNDRHIDARLLKLKKMHGGRVWESLKEPILRDLRYGEAVFLYDRLISRITPPHFIFNDLTVVDMPSSLAAVPAFEEWTPRLHLKTNLIGWAMFSANMAVEADLARHWSVELPIYYCGMDWFTPTIKFRNLSTQPEVRYWFRRSDNDGLFLGAHFGLSSYNFAFGGKYRYQDFFGCTPAWGGGLSAGYRIPISKDKRWRMEFTMGAGIYPLDYSVFDNTPDVKDGQWLFRNKKTYIGVDRAAISFAYSFDMERFTRTYRKKGGGR